MWVHRVCTLILGWWFRYLYYRFGDYGPLTDIGGGVVFESFQRLFGKLFFYDSPMFQY